MNKTEGEQTEKQILKPAGSLIKWVTLMRLVIGVVIFMTGFGSGIVVTYMSKPPVSPQPKVKLSLTVTPAPVYKPIVLGWIPYWDQQKAIKSFREQIDVFDYISFFWYGLDSQGELQTYDRVEEDQAIITLAHENEIKVMAVVANLPDYSEGGNWDWRRVDKVIKTAEDRQKHVQALLKLIQSNNLDGVNIDYESLKLSQKDNFSLFIEELSRVFHDSGKLVGVSIHPKTSENNPNEANGSQAQDLERISAAADHLYFMTYEQHNETSQPGPTGSVGWMREVLTYATRDLQIEKDKVFVGIPLYGFDWPKRSPQNGKGLVFEEVTDLIEANYPELAWSEEFGETSFTYTRSGEHTVWFNDQKSVKAKFNLAKELGVPGLAFWRLGGEDEGVWDVVGK